MFRISVTITFLMLIVFSDGGQAPTIRLNNGYKMPVIGLGTFESTSGEVGQAVKDAIDAGYRHIDTAFLYGNEAEVGLAIKAKIDEGVLKRRDIFVTTKLWNTFHDPEYVEKAFQRSFDNLNLGYIDLYLIHYPIAYGRVIENSRLPPDDVNAFYVFPFEDGASIRCLTSQLLYHVFSATRLFCRTAKMDVDYLDTWRAMERLVESGRVRISIANKQIGCCQSLRSSRSQISAERNITITAFSPLGRPHTPGGQRLAISDSNVAALARKYSKTPAQIILRYTIQNGAIVIPKSTNTNRIRENMNIFDFQLSESDMKIMHSLNNNHRLIAYEGDKDSKYYPFNIEF